METILLIGVVGLFALALMGGGQQPLPKVPQVVYVMETPKRDVGQGGGCMFLLVLGVIALLALSMPA
jgi:hypothetical protein